MEGLQIYGVEIRKNDLKVRQRDFVVMFIKLAFNNCYFIHG